MPQMVFEYILKKNGIDPTKDLHRPEHQLLVSPRRRSPAMIPDYTVEFEPFATALEQEGNGYVVASLGKDSGYVPYTAYSAKKSYIEKHPEIIQKFTNAIQRRSRLREYPLRRGDCRDDQNRSLRETDTEKIAIIVDRYKEQDTWKGNTVFEKESFEPLRTFLEEAGELDTRVPYEDLVKTEFAKGSRREITFNRERSGIF